MTDATSRGGPALPVPGLEGVPGEIAYLRLPRPAEAFERRAVRFGDLAPGNPMGEFLEALGHLSRAQRQALDLLGTGPREEVRRRALPASVPLRSTTWPRDPSWRVALGAIAGAMRATPLPAPAVAALGRIEGASAADLEALADAVIADTVAPRAAGLPETAAAARPAAGAALDLATAPFAAAALQVYFSALAAELPEASVERSRSGCPVCGSPPVAGVVGGDDRVRYLTCALCGTEWNLARIQCWDCRATGGISYLAVEAEPGLKAELCAGCGAYLKLFYREKRPAAEPFADDVASLTLDLLAAQEGWARGGVNLFLLGGTDG
jgi:FdhE protein